MFMTLKQLARKIKRSESFARICIDRYGIEKVKFKRTDITVFDITKEKLETIKEFVKKRDEKRNRKTNK